jgi:hypothetical protein
LWALNKFLIEGVFMRASYVSVLTILFCSVIYSIPAYPQEDTTKYKTEEIMVTGTRTEEKIINIP